MTEETGEIVEALCRLRSAVENKTFNKLSPIDFRVFIQSTRKEGSVSDCILEETLENLIIILRFGQLSNDSQIVISTAYSNVATRIFKTSENIFHHFLQLLAKNENNRVKIFLCHAVLQLNNNLWLEHCETKNILLQEIFKIVKHSCSELSSTSFLGFKVLYSLLCKINQEFTNGRGVSKEGFSDMFNIVMCNWENPLTGIRQQNSLIMGQLLLFNRELWDDALSEAIENENLVNHYKLIQLVFGHISWSLKSKYFVLTAVFQKSDPLKVFEEFGDDLVDGLVFSLTVPHLVSAGTDLYRTILGSLPLEKWKQLFLPSFRYIFSSISHSLELENIFSYWVPHTVKKFPQIMEDLLKTNALNLYSFIMLHKLGRKEGFPCSIWEVINKQRLKTALEIHSDNVRAQAFSLVCVSSKTSVFPTEIEFELVKDFLRQNISSDNSALRQHSLTSFTNFIIRNRDSLLNVLKGKTSEDLKWSSICFSFLDWLHQFLIFNLESSCNYQRKVTSLELYKIVLMYFGDQVKKEYKSYVRKSNKDHLILKKYADTFSWEYKFESKSSREVLISCLLDEDNKVRSSSASILMSYFEIDDSDFATFEKIFKTALDLRSSHMFYKAEAGAQITQVLVTLTANSSSEKIRNVLCCGNNSFFNCLLSSAEEQFESLKKDLLKSAVKGSFLYGTLETLYLLLADSSCSSPEFMEQGSNNLESLLTLIERATKFFIEVLSSKSDHNSVCAPSFGEMGMAIAAVVENSSLNVSEVLLTTTEDTIDGLQLTPAQQLVLSCVWLNIKVCVKLCSELVKKGLSLADTEHCVSVVVSVLRRCRHKGAIESAGVALSHITSTITARDDAQFQSLSDSLLEEFLQSFVGCTASTVSRRSAGLAILVHRLITGDSRANKPLLHTCLAKLLSVAGDSSGVSSDRLLVDLPQTQAMHFLRTLVQESILREHMTQYTLAISLVALENLASPIWTVRNAALQLFGALVPKLVGQKPHQDEGKGHHRLAFEELYIHAKPLVEMMLKEFSSAATSNSMHVHSKLMPLLTLVSNLTVGLQALNRKDVSKIVSKFQLSFQQLFKSNIYSVRKLGAKAHSLFLTSAQLYPIILNRVQEILWFLEGKVSVIKSQNELNAFVLNLYFLVERLNEERIGMKMILPNEESMTITLYNFSTEVLKSVKVSSFTKSIIFELLKMPFFLGKPTKIIVNFCNQGIGFPELIQKLVMNLFMNNKEENLKDVELCLLEKSGYDVHLACLKSLSMLLKLNNVNLGVKTYHLQELLKIFEEFLLKRNCDEDELLGLSLEAIVVVFEIWLRVKHQVSSTSLSPEFLLFCNLHLTSQQTTVKVFNLLMPVTCGLLSVQENADFGHTEKLITLLKNQSEPSSDEDNRLYAAKSLFFLIPVFKLDTSRESKLVEIVWEACVNLLQDEVPSVRYEASRFVTVIFSEQHDYVWNPYLSLEHLCECSFITKLMTPSQAFFCLWKQMTSVSRVNLQSEKMTLNPFDHEVKNIYAEESVISFKAYSCILGLSKYSVEDAQLKFKVKEACDCFINTMFVPNKVMDYVKEISNTYSLI